MGNTWVGVSATQIAHAVQRGDASATAVLADHVDHARVADRVLTALRVLRDGAALAEAEQVDELPDLAHLPLAGVPVVISENTPIAGVPTWNGSEAARSSVAGYDHEVVRRLRGAGAVVLGVARMSELALWPTTDDATGITRNPWRSDRSAGGASGGAAAAVAAGLVPVAHGTDNLGSVRIPAACCGVVGFKPGRGVIPYGLPADWYGLAEHGVLATSVADAAAAFGTLAATPGRTSEPGRLRFAVSIRNPSHGSLPDADTRESVARAARLLVAAGHNAVRADPPHPARLALVTTATWFAAAHQAAAQQAAAHQGTAHRAGAHQAAAQQATTDAASESSTMDELQARTRRHAALGARAVRRGLVRDGERADWRDRSVAWFSEHGIDLLLTPALAGPPPSADGWSSRSWRVNMANAVRFAPYTGVWNLAGLPALVLPMGQRRDHLPASVQLVGPPGAEATLLAVAAQLEAASPWPRHAPTWPRASA